MKKENKDIRVSVRLSESQVQALQKQLIDTGKAKGQSAAIQYLINEMMIKG
ncbi:MULTISPECIES: hypothetical protein [Enterobacteriaceae]|uniref:hypothetical protein n=1 Tax=Enterobacteriaceae TaxID=543 RepID=UPI0016520E16|nr:MULTISPECIES: hypothetical protein [Enterobacteriaceae]MCR4457023.1 hypothetical protein [Pseudescherichia sp. L3]